ncbi:MAG: L-threonylcarbamoyladenylate synthase [Proteobacteria bacterium]|nr:L-threonylcarbamoyladenylate synthase [Pseudomonadota bacterium]
MSQYFAVHPTHPQPRLIAQAAAIIRAGGVIAYPTDSCYAIGCQIGDKDAMQRLRTIRKIDDKHHLTLMCRDLSEIATYAQVDNVQYRLLKKITPGSYTFILQASREVPRRLLHPRRKTIGLRVPEHAVANALLSALGEPLLSATLSLPGDAQPLNDAQEIRERLEHSLDLVLDGGSCGIDPTTMVDLTGTVPQLLRQGKGSIEPFGFDA